MKSDWKQLLFLEGKDRINSTQKSHLSGGRDEGI